MKRCSTTQKAAAAVSKVVVVKVVSRVARANRAAARVNPPVVHQNRVAAQVSPAAAVRVVHKAAAVVSC
jgi:hypothetical protein